MNKNEIIELTSLRGIAAICVVIHHSAMLLAPAAGNTVLGYTHFIANSYLWVDLFFLLSGFVLTYVYSQKKILNKHTYWNFIVARFARIYPLHLFMLLLFVCLEYAFWLANKPAFKEPNTIENLIHNIFLLQAVQINPSATSWNHPAWSISVEWINYLIFPIMLYVAHRLKSFRWACAVAAIFSLAVISHLTPFRLDVTGVLGIARCAAEVFIGTTLALYLQQNTNSEQTQLLPPYIVGGLFWITLFLLLTALHLPDINDSITVALFALLIFLSSSNNRSLVEHPIRKILRWQPLYYLGVISYAIYLNHIFLFSITTLFLDLININLRSLPLQIQFSCLILSVAISISVAIPLYQFIERPLRTLIRQHWTTA